MQLGETLKTHNFPLKISHFVGPPKFGTEVIILPSFFRIIFKACQRFPARFPTFLFRLPVSDRSIPPVWYPGWKVGIPSARRSLDANATGRSWTVAKSCTCHGMPGSPSEPSGGGGTLGEPLGVSGRSVWSWMWEKEMLLELRVLFFKCGSWWFGWMAGYIDLRFF